MLSPGPAFVAGPFAAFDFVHMRNAQLACPAECRKIGDQCERAAWRHETGVLPAGFSSFATQVCPSPVADNSSVGYGHHVSFIEPVLAAEFREVRNRGRDLSAGIDKAIVAFHIVAFAYAVLMRPSFVGL